MVYSVNQKINPNQQQMVMGMNSNPSVNNGVAMGLNTPQLQDVNVDTVAQNSALKGIHDEEDGLFSMKTFLYSLPVTAAMIYGMDKFNAACGGADYEKSLVGRINKYGENLGKKVPFVDSVFTKIDSAIHWFKTKVATKTSITSSFFNNPSKPESHAVLMMSMGTHAEIATEAVQRMEQYIKQGGKLAPGTATVAEIEKLVKDGRTPENVQRILDICKEQGHLFLKKENFGSLKSIPLIGRLFKKDIYVSSILPKSLKEGLTRKLYFSEFANKIQAIEKPIGTTTIGKKSSKTVLRVIEGLTNGTAGGKIAVFMGAYFVADAIKKAIDAPHKKGEKRKVFAENMISNVGMYMTMPLSIVLMHKFGGLQYLGMGKGAKQTENLAEYRKLLGDINEGVEKGTINKVDYETKVKKLKKIRVSALKWLPTDSAAQKGLKVLRNIVYRPIMWILKPAAVGLERIKPYTKDTDFIAKIFNPLKKASYKVKGWAGYPVRMGIFMFAIAPFFSKYLAKASHLLFGRPEKSILDEGKEHPEESTNHQPEPVVGVEQDGKIQPPPSVMMPTKQNTQIKPFERQNLLDLYKTQHATQQSAPTAQNYMYSTSQQAPSMIPTDDDKTRRRYIPSSAPAMVSNGEPARGYIPSASGVVINPNIEFQESLKAQDAFMKAEKAELRAKGHVD